MGLRDDILAFRPYNEQEETEKRLMLQYMDTFPDLLTRENEMAHFTASCWIVNPARTHALMAFHNLYQSWAWLGGHADGEEDLLRVALREANEESGIVGARPLRNDIFSLEILGVDGHVKRGLYVATQLFSSACAASAARRAASACSAARRSASAAAFSASMRACASALAA